MTRAAVLGTTLTLLRQAVAGPERAVRGLRVERNADWLAVVALASGHLVLPALAGAARRLPGQVPGDAGHYLGQMEAANRARNLSLRAHLLELARELNRRGVVPVPLKGAAWLAGAGAATDPAAWRFMSDLDVLVPAGRLGDCVAAARELGFRAPERSYMAERDGHYPALASPCGRFTLELHTRLFAERRLAGLEAAHGRPAHAGEAEGAWLGLPDAAARLAHLIAHAQLHHGHHKRRRLHLRGLLEVSMLARSLGRPIEWSPVLAMFAEGPERRAAAAFVAAWRLVMDERADSVFLSRDDVAWAAGALARLDRSPAMRGLGDAARQAGLEIGRLVRQPRVLMRHLATLASPRELADRLGRRAGSLRQSHWA